mgnify:CR=1 FL=1
MAKLECELKGDFHQILDELMTAVLDGSLSASMEDGSTFETEGCLCAVRVLERYSVIGGNRVSLSITLLQTADKIYLSAIASGGSQGVVLKINTFGEEAFLDSIRGVVKKYRI